MVRPTGLWFACDAAAVQRAVPCSFGDEAGLETGGQMLFSGVHGSAALGAGGAAGGSIPANASIQRARRLLARVQGELK